MTGNGYIELKKVLKDYLKEQGIILNDLLVMMDEDKRGIMEALDERVHLTTSQKAALERSLSSKNLNLLLFVVQAFYLINPAGMYKGFIIEPARENLVWGEKVTFEGCKIILKALRISAQGLEV